MKRTQTDTKRLNKGAKGTDKVEAFLHDYHWLATRLGCSTKTARKLVTNKEIDYYKTSFGHKFDDEIVSSYKNSIRIFNTNSEKDTKKDENLLPR